LSCSVFFYTIYFLFKIYNDANHICWYVYCIISLIGIKQQTELLLSSSFSTI